MTLKVLWKVKQTATCDLPRKISADDAAALTFGAGGRTVERIQRVSEAEVEHPGGTIGTSKG